MSEDPSESTNLTLDVVPTTAKAALDPAQRSDAATKAILRQLFEELNANEAGVLRNADPECLHDFRIAVRRTRSALGQLKGVFPERTARRFAARFAWLGTITSPPRDLDVYLLGFDQLKAGLAGPFRDGIEPLRVFLQSHCDLAHAKLNRQLQSVRYRALLASWEKFLALPCPKRPHAPKALMSAKAMADSRIWKLFRRVLKEGKHIDGKSPAERIHELRKTCKKLRYLLEFFRPLYPAEAIERPVKQLKKLQNYLGDFQDVHARIDMLRGISHQMRKNSTVPTHTLLALGGLLAALDDRQAALRKAFPKHFSHFANSKNRQRFEALFKPVQGLNLDDL